MPEEFLHYLRSELNRSPLTVEAYCRDIREFADWLGAGPSDLLRPDAVMPNDIRRWLGDLSLKGISRASLRRKTQSLRAFFRWGMISGKLGVNPAQDVALAKTPRHLPDIVKSSEMEKILDAGASREDNVGMARTHLILSMLYGLGLRQAELLALTDADFRNGGRELRVFGKGSKERVIPVPDELYEEIRAWRQVRDDAYPGLPSPRPLIANRNGAISKSTLYLAVKNALAGTSADRRSPHTLRHAFATSLLADGASLDAVRQLLGHASLATTQIYTHLTPDELRRAYTFAHPRAHKQEEK